MRGPGILEYTAKEIFVELSAEGRKLSVCMELLLVGCVLKDLSAPQPNVEHFVVPGRPNVMPLP